MSEGKKPLLMALDDDPDFLALISVLLNDLGLEVRARGSAAGFVEEVVQTRPDLVMVDLRIQGCDLGFELIRSIRTRMGNDLPLFVASGVSESQGVAHAVEMGATDYLVKPLDRAVLATRLQAYVSTRQLSESGLRLFSVPQGGSPASLHLEFGISAVDECGLTLSAPHLPIKGSTLGLSGALIEEITGKQDVVNVRVVSTAALWEGGGFSSYAEFDSADEELRASVRAWIARANSGASRQHSDQT